LRQQTSKLHKNGNRKAAKVQYEMGQKVMYRNFKKPKEGVRGKLERKWIGPFSVDGRKSSVIHVIRSVNLQALERQVHVDQLRPFYTNREPSSGQEPGQAETAGGSKSTGQTQRQNDPASEKRSEEVEKAELQNRFLANLDVGQPVVIFYKGHYSDCGYIMPDQTIAHGERRRVDSDVVMTLARRGSRIFVRVPGKCRKSVVLNSSSTAVEFVEYLIHWLRKSPFPIISLTVLGDRRGELPVGLAVGTLIHGGSVYCLPYNVICHPVVLGLLDKILLDEQFVKVIYGASGFVDRIRAWFHQFALSFLLWLSFTLDLSSRFWMDWVVCGSCGSTAPLC